MYEIPKDVGVSYYPESKVEFLRGEGRDSKIVKPQDFTLRIDMGK